MYAQLLLSPKDKFGFVHVSKGANTCPRRVRFVSLEDAKRIFADLQRSQIITAEDREDFEQYVSESKVPSEKKRSWVRRLVYWKKLPPPETTTDTLRQMDELDEAARADYIALHLQR